MLINIFQKLQFAIQNFLQQIHCISFMQLHCKMFQEHFNWWTSHQVDHLLTLHIRDVVQDKAISNILHQLTRYWWSIEVCWKQPLSNLNNSFHAKCSKAKNDIVVWWITRANSVLNFFCRYFLNGLGMW